MRNIRCGAFIASALFILFASVFARADEGGKIGKKPVFTKHFQESLFDITEYGSFSIEILLNENEYRIGKNTIGIIIHDQNDKDVKGADLIIVYKNLETGEIFPARLKIIDKGNGLYIISGLELQSTGRTELMVRVKKSKKDDLVSFIFPDALKQHYPKGRYSQ